MKCYFCGKELSTLDDIRHIRPCDYHLVCLKHRKFAKIKNPIIYKIVKFFTKTTVK